jgi:hypothetical protein
MSTATIFISYRHGDPSTGIADALYTALSAVAEGLEFELVMDTSLLEPSDLFDPKILAGLDRATHFLALIDNQYWASSYCRKEMARAVSRFESHDGIRLLFVMAGAIHPQYMTFAGDRASGAISSEPLIKRVGDLQFLGPFSNTRRLERLAWEDPARLSDQISGLIDQLVRVLPARPQG